MWYEGTQAERVDTLCACACVCVPAPSWLPSANAAIPPPLPPVRCMGHSGTVQHVDWSLPVDLGGTPFDGKFAIQSCDSSGDMLYWDPYSGAAGRGVGAVRGLGGFPLGTAVGLNITTGAEPLERGEVMTTTAPRAMLYPMLRRARYLAYGVTHTTPAGKKLPYNMRDAEWHTWTLRVGFDVMGIWPDGSDGTDVNSVDRCRLGAPIYDPFGELWLARRGQPTRPHLRHSKQRLAAVAQR